jgi:hypothetical protein
MVPYTQHLARNELVSSMTKNTVSLQFTESKSTYHLREWSLLPGSWNPWWLGGTLSPCNLLRPCLSWPTRWSSWQSWGQSFRKFRSQWFRQVRRRFQYRKIPVMKSTQVMNHEQTGVLEKKCPDHKKHLTTFENRCVDVDTYKRLIYLRNYLIQFLYTEDNWHTDTTIIFVC